MVGAEWVLYFLILISVVSVALIIERWMFYRSATQGLADFRFQIREMAAKGNWEAGSKVAKDRAAGLSDRAPDPESSVAIALLENAGKKSGQTNPEILSELAQDAVLRTKNIWEKNLAILATIGSNSPFVGLFGTVLGIIKAFNDLSTQAGAGAQTVSSGLSEALVATAVGILVAIPAVVAFNLFQRRVKSAMNEAEALKSFLIGKIAAGN